MDLFYFDFHLFSAVFYFYDAVKLRVAFLHLRAYRKNYTMKWKKKKKKIAGKPGSGQIDDFVVKTIR